MIATPSTPPRADLQRRLDRGPDAAAAYDTATVLAPTEPERRYLAAQATTLR